MHIFDRFFPIHKPRPSQSLVVEEILRNVFTEGVDTVLVEAPTGSGKSFIALAVAKAILDIHNDPLNQIVISTPKKALQDQYLQDFSAVESLTGRKGKSSYKCGVADVPATSCPVSNRKKANKAEINKGRSPHLVCGGPGADHNNCEYRRMLKETRLSSMVVTNYHTLRLHMNKVTSSISLTVLRGPSADEIEIGLQEKEGIPTLIIDEAHEFLKFLTSSFSTSIDLRAVFLWAFGEVKLISNNMDALYLEEEHDQAVFMSLVDSIDFESIKLEYDETKVIRVGELSAGAHSSKLSELLDSILFLLTLCDQGFYPHEIHYRVLGLIFYELENMIAAEHFEENYARTLQDILHSFKSELHRIDVGIMNSIGEPALVQINYKDRRDAAIKQHSFSLSRNSQNKYFLDITCVSPCGPYRRLFAKSGQVNIFMSGSMDSEQFKRELRLNPKKTRVVTVDLSIPIDTRPLIYIGDETTKLSYAELEKNLPNAARICANVLQFHKNLRGIIHTNSTSITFALQKLLKEYLPRNEYARILWHFKGPKEAILQKFLQDTKNRMILVSPSIMEGFDGKGDIARWQIILKIPYPPLKSPEVQERMKASKVEGDRWYTSQVLESLTQAYGRVNRGEGDLGITYIVDGALTGLLHKANKLGLGDSAPETLVSGLEYLESFVFIRDSEESEWCQFPFREGSPRANTIHKIAPRKLYGI